MTTRDELAGIISKALGEITGIFDTSDAEDLELADAIIAAGFPVTLPKPIPKTREEMATFAKDWDAKVEKASRGPATE